MAKVRIILNRGQSLAESADVAKNRRDNEFAVGGDEAVLSGKLDSTQPFRKSISPAKLRRNYELAILVCVAPFVPNSYCGKTFAESSRFIARHAQEMPDRSELRPASGAGPSPRMRDPAPGPRV